MYHTKLLFLLVATACIASSSQEKLKLTLFYESLCEDCHDFISNQLVPGYKILGDYLDLELLPYGNADRIPINGTTSVECQHGDQECAGNKIQACGLNLTVSQKDQLGFVHCMTTDNPDSLVLAKECATNNNISWESLEACIDGQLGDELIDHLADLTENANPRPDYVPYLRINDTSDNSVDERISNNFMSICSYFHEKPSVCP